jgi:uncharacterized membrane protein
MWGHYGFGCFGFFLFLLVVGFFVVRACIFRNYAGSRHRWHDEADAILRKRLASGEIDEAEYQKLQNALKK